MFNFYNAADRQKVLVSVCVCVVDVKARFRYKGHNNKETTHFPC